MTIVIMSLQPSSTKREQKYNEPPTFRHSLSVRYARIVQIGVEHDDAEREDESSVRVGEHRCILPQQQQ